MQEAKEDVANKLVDDLEAAAARLYSIYKPQWDARTDVLKTIISLSSASIVLSVTFSSSLRNLHLDPNWRYFILFSFAMFVVSLTIAVAALWINTRLYELQSDTFNARIKVKSSFIKTKSHEEFLDAFAEIQNPLTLRIVNSDQTVNRLFHACITSFCLAIASLAMVGANQLMS